MALSPARLAGAVTILAGLILFAFGGSWAPAALEMTAGVPLGEWLEQFLPFIPLALVGVGAVLLVSSDERQQ